MPIARILDAEINGAEEVSRKIKQAFTQFPNWMKSESSLRELRKKMTFAVYETESKKIVHIKELQRKR